MKQFFAVTTSGKLVSGATATKFMPVPCELYVKQKILRQQLLANDDVTFAGGIDSPQPEVRIMDALGSKTNTEDFVLLQEQINGMKARVCFWILDFVLPTFCLDFLPSLYRYLVI